MAQRTLQDIFDKLDMKDATAFKDNVPNDPAVQRCYQSRIDPIAYFSKTFKFPATLMAAMFDSSCFLSGSRALEWFVPGSTRPDSDWDFYVPGYKESVADMVRALTLCGVSWQLEADSMVSRLWEDGSVVVDASVMMALSSWHKEDIECGPMLNDILRGFEKFPMKSGERAYKISLDGEGGGGILFTPEEKDELPVRQAATEYADPLGQPFNILRGTVSTASGDQKVQLIIGCFFSGAKTSLSFIKDFYASHVQCFTSGWCASHMYFHDASRKRAILWHSSTKSRAVEKAVQKYQNRGFQFYLETATYPTIRRFRDSETLLLDFGQMWEFYVRKEHHGLLELWLKERRENIDAISWTECNGRIVSLNSPMECLRNGTSHAHGGDEMPLNRLRRLGDMVSSQVPPFDEMRSQDFCSSVRKTVAGTEWQVHEAAKSGTVFNALRDATPWSWVL
ncbi:hypothetical protein QQZ08_011583 [Neonectria magnoliae]|uniref:Uncharacterized protein n=1 Tax=Neonectria magnoliae TaxID=2732573 RepID=A0ABR1H8Z0_9HYPO